MTSIPCILIVSHPSITIFSRHTFIHLIPTPLNYVLLHTQPLNLFHFHSFTLCSLLFYSSFPLHLTSPPLNPSTPLCHYLINIKVVRRKITSPHPSSPLPLLFLSSEKKDHITVAVRPQRSRDLNNVLLPASPAYSQSGIILFSSI